MLILTVDRDQGNLLQLLCFKKYFSGLYTHVYCQRLSGLGQFSFKCLESLVHHAGSEGKALSLKGKGPWVQATAASTTFDLAPSD